MKSFSFEELSELAQQNAINLYYADSDYQAFIEKVRKSNPDECPMNARWWATGHKKMEFVLMK